MEQFIRGDSGKDVTTGVKPGSGKAAEGRNSRKKAFFQGKNRKSGDTEGDIFRKKGDPDEENAEKSGDQDGDDSGNKTAEPEELPAEMRTGRAGVFVSIHEHGRLRGCIGTIAPVTDCIAEEIRRNAVSAATEDPRFDPITVDELKWLEISVDVLGSPEQISGIEELDPGRYGVIVSRGRRRGLLLPALDGVDTPQQQIAIARRKAGISPDEDVQLERFEVVRHY